MEIPAWFETLFEKVVVVFEMPASDTLKAAGSPDLLPWLCRLLSFVSHLLKVHKVFYLTNDLF